MPSVEMERVALPLENMQASISLVVMDWFLEITQPSQLERTHAFVLKTRDVEQLLILETIHALYLVRNQRIPSTL